MVPRYYSMLRLCHVCASKCISWALAGTAYAAGHKTEMRLSASFEVLSGLIPFRSDHVLSGVASTILDGEVSTVTSLKKKLRSVRKDARPLGMATRAYHAYLAYLSSFHLKHCKPGARRHSQVAGGWPGNLYPCVIPSYVFSSYRPK